MAKDKKDWKYMTIGQVVLDTYEPKNEDGSPKLDKKGNPICNEYHKLRLGTRYKKDSNEVSNGVELSKEEKEQLASFIFDKDIYLFDPADSAPDFIVKNVSVKIEDMQSDSEAPKSKKGKVQF